MRQPDPDSNRTRTHSARLPGVLGLLLLAGLLLAAPASAGYEEVGTFAGSATPVAEEKFSEEVQLGGIGGMAVNYTGAGGVPAGTVYATSYFGGLRIAMFTPTPNGGLEFREAWEVTATEKPYERCGPALGTHCSTRVKERPGKVDVDVDQSTGNVYVFNEEAVGSPEFRLLTIYNPDGSEAIARFGKRAAEGKTVAETPGEIHGSTAPGTIAVSSAGVVYVHDVDNNNYHRLMVFKPQSAGDYEHYVYAGEVAVAAEGAAEDRPTRPVMDAAGNIYTVGGQLDSFIEMRAPETPSAYPAPETSPICRFEEPKGGIYPITVNPESGEVFFFSFKREAGFKFKLIHQLGPCNEETGEFEEIGKFEVRPERGDLWGLAFDPLRQLDPSRPAGVLYGGAQGDVPNSGVGKGEPGQSSLGYIFSRAAAAPPEVKSESVAHVTASTAELSALIDPKGQEIHYAFQYLTEAEYEANEPADRFAGAKEAPPGGAVGGGQKPLSTAVSLTGLSPDTAYRYRAVATSHCSVEEPEKVCEGVGAAEAFHTFPSEAPGLADHRAWELVSPANKNGGEVFAAEPDLKSCYPSKCKPVYARPYPMQSAPDGEAVAYQGQSFSFTEGAVNENEYVSRRDAKTGWQTTILSPALATRGGSQGYVAFDRALNRGLLFQERPTLSPEAPSEFPNLYAQATKDPLALTPLLGEEAPNRAPRDLFLTYGGGSADLSRIFFAANDALTSETPFAPEAVDGGKEAFNLYEWAEGQLRLVNVAPGNAETEPMVSLSEGAQVAISKDGSRAFFTNKTGQLFLREDGEVTVEIPDPGKFVAAAADGSKVLLGDGLLFDVENLAAEPVDLSEGKGGFEGILGQSEDLSAIYFIDTAVLTGEEENDHGAKAQAGKENIYAWNGGTAHFIATLEPIDDTRLAEASPQGRYLAFLSQASLTGYDNTGPCVPTNNSLNVPCSEAFLYDSDSGKLLCASCNPTGTRPLGPTRLRGTISPKPRYLTDEGRLYFDSQDSLSPFDTNEGTVPGHAVEDVYQYEPDEVGTCKREAGCVTLISAGHEASDSNFLAMDEDGKDIFFTTRDQLVLKDHDDAIDLYVAREDGGIPAETEVARGECQGEACQPLASTPNDPTPASSTFEGAGNVEEKKPAKKHKHKKKRHAKKHAHKRAANHNRGGAK